MHKAWEVWEDWFTGGFPAFQASQVFIVYLKTAFWLRVLFIDVIIVDKPDFVK